MLRPNSHQERTQSRRGSRSERRRGHVLLEFALTWTVFLLVTVVGIMDFGRGIWAYNVLAHSSHEGVRYAIVHGAESATPATAADIQTFVRSRATFLDPSSVQVNVTWAPDNSPRSLVEVETRHTFQPLMGFMLPDIPLSSTATMMITY